MNHSPNRFGQHSPVFDYVPSCRRLQRNTGGPWPEFVGLIALTAVASACADDPAPTQAEANTGVVGTRSDETSGAPTPKATEDSDGALIPLGPELCGNGIVDDFEDCDDGNLAWGDGCSGSCLFEEYCGNGVLAEGEACDDGNAVRGDGCSSCDVVDQFWTCPVPGEACVLSFICGDGIIGGPELCDDGNATSGDGCSANCSVEDAWRCGAEGKPCRPLDPIAAAGVREDAGVSNPGRCGDGVVTDGEACDDGTSNGADYGGCMACELGPYCGDGVVDTNAREECDNGTNLDFILEDESSCAPGCRIPTCGDGVLQSETEQCDAGRDPATGELRASGGYNHCNRNCTLAERCGDGIVDGGVEQCDDGNRRDDDWCDTTCQPNHPGRIDR